jgi:hypothetical protein
MVDMNLTTSVYNMVSPESFGWLITLAVFLSIFLVSFLLWKNFRRAIVGGSISGVMYVVYSISRGIGESVEKGNYESIIIFSWIVGFVLFSILIGKLSERVKLFNEIINENDKHVNSKRWRRLRKKF